MRAFVPKRESDVACNEPISGARANTQQAQGGISLRRSMRCTYDRIGKVQAYSESGCELACTFIALAEGQFKVGGKNSSTACPVSKRSIQSHPIELR
jgi:hypothetical protein